MLGLLVTADNVTNVTEDVGVHPLEAGFIAVLPIFSLRWKNHSSAALKESARVSNLVHLTRGVEMKDQ